MPAPVPIDLAFPRPVLVTLAGRPCRAGELTLGERATLQSWLRQAAPHPLAGLVPYRDDPEPGTRRARLLAAWEAAKSWPPRLGTRADSALLASAEGRAVFLLVCLADRNEGFDATAASELASAMTPADWAALRRVAWGTPPWRVLAAELDPAWLEDQIRRNEADDDGADWGELVAHVMRRGGYTYADLESWTATQLRLYCSEGALDEYRAVMRPGEARDDFGRRMVATFSVAGPCGATATATATATADPTPPGATPTPPPTDP